MIGRIFISMKRVIWYFIKKYQKSQFKMYGQPVWFGNNCTFTYKNISLGNFVSIGSGACLQSTHGEIIIGNHVMFGPGVHIHGGNHNINVVGQYMDQIQNKENGSDGKVIIGDDVWVGACAIILKGVTIGEGSIIGAGSIVTKDIPPYSVYTGAPSCKLKPRWDDQTINKHKQLLCERGTASAE